MVYHVFDENFSYRSAPDYVQLLIITNIVSRTWEVEYCVTVYFRDSKKREVVLCIFIYVCHSYLRNSQHENALVEAVDAAPSRHDVGMLHRSAVNKQNMVTKLLTALYRMLQLRDGLLELLHSVD